MNEPLDELSRLPRETAPPAGLEGRVAAALRRHGLLSTHRRWQWSHLAAAVVVFAVGAVFGRLAVPERGAPLGRSEPRFLLLLLPAGPDTGTEAERVAAYGAWASRQRAGGRQITGDRLAPTPGVVVGAAGAEATVPDELTGFFIISAADAAEAIEVARTSPHAEGGGRVIVRPIDTP